MLVAIWRQDYSRVCHCIRFCSRDQFADCVQPCCVLVIWRAGSLLLADSAAFSAMSQACRCLSMSSANVFIGRTCGRFSGPASLVRGPRDCRTRWWQSCVPCLGSVLMESYWHGLEHLIGSQRTSGKEACEKKRMSISCMRPECMPACSPAQSACVVLRPCAWRLGHIRDFGVRRFCPPRVSCLV